MANKKLKRTKSQTSLWELRLLVTDQSLAQCREACRKLACANDELTNQLYHAEKDTIDIVGFLKTEPKRRRSICCRKASKVKMHLRGAK